MTTPSSPPVTFDLDALDAVITPLAAGLRARGWRVATAESCTGGLIAAACTSQAGSSDWFDRGFVTDSNEAKVEALGVPAALIAAHGAVSEPVARAMAEGALTRSAAQLAVAVTGVAGPGGGSQAKPVGLVWMALASRPLAGDGSLRLTAWRLQLPGGRAAVRSATVLAALARLTESAA
jgi:nicotinamide-nucleotide amidase